MLRIMHGCKAAYFRNSRIQFMHVHTLTHIHRHIGWGLYDYTRKKSRKRIMERRNASKHEESEREYFESELSVWHAQTLYVCVCSKNISNTRTNENLSHPNTNISRIQSHFETMLRALSHTHTHKQLATSRRICIYIGESGTRLDTFWVACQNRVQAHNIDSSRKHTQRACVAVHSTDTPTQAWTNAHTYAHIYIYKHGIAS